jgi:hypothetical protein
VWLGPGGQDVIAFCGQALEDSDYLLVSFAGAVYDFRKAPADCPMVVHAGKTQVLKRQMTEFFNRLVDIDFAALDLF